MQLLDGMRSVTNKWGLLVSVVLVIIKWVTNVVLIIKGGV